MNRSEFLAPKKKDGARVVFEMPVPENLVREKFSELNEMVRVDIHSQVDEMKAVLKEFGAAIKEIKSVIASIPKNIEMILPKMPEPVAPIVNVDMAPVIAELRRPRTRTITGRRGEHGLIDLNSITIKES